MDEAEEVLDVIFPSGNESAEVVHPGEEPLHFPSSLVAPQLASVLRLSAPAPVGRDQLDAVLLFELLIESVRVVGFVSDELFGEFIEETSGEDLFDKLAFVRRSALDRYGERKTVISGDSDDLRPFAAPGGADGKPPFFALAKVASTNASSRLSLPCSRRCRASSLRAPSSFPDRTHCWNRRWQVWYGGYFSGNSRHCAPVPSTHNTPFNTARVSCHGRPRLSARRSGRSTGSTTSHCSSVNSQRPTIGACGDTQSIHRMPLFTTGNVYETGTSVSITERPSHSRRTSQKRSVALSSRSASCPLPETTRANALINSGSNSDSRRQRNIAVASSRWASVASSNTFTPFLSRDVGLATCRHPR